MNQATMKKGSPNGGKTKNNGPPTAFHGTTTIVKCAGEVFKELDEKKSPANAASIEQVNEFARMLADFCRPSRAEINFKMHISNLLAKALQSEFPGATLCRSGSMVNLLGLRDSDVDLVLAYDEDGQDEEYGPHYFGNKYSFNAENRVIAVRMLGKMKEVLDSKPFIDVVYLIDAQVPILEVQLKFPYNGVKIDIAYNNKVGIYNSHLLLYYGRLDPRIRALITIVKLWGRARGVVDSPNGRLNSYTIALMALHYLQCVVTPPIAPNLMDDKLVDRKTKRKLFDIDDKDPVSKLNYNLPLNSETMQPTNPNPRGLGELLYGFFKYYGWHFNYGRDGISIREARTFNRAEYYPQKAKYCFFLEEPFERGGMPSALNNITDGNVLEWMVEEFRKTARDQLEGMVGSG